MKAIKILSTKTLDGETERLFTSRGFNLVSVPMIKTRAWYTANQLTTILKQCQSDAWVFTSSYAARLVAERGLVPSDKKIGATAPSTSRLLEKKGFTLTWTAPSALLLAEEITRDQTVETVHFFRGNMSLVVLPAYLGRAGIQVKTTTLYETTLHPVPVDLSDIEGVMFFSPSAVKSFFQVNSLPPDTGIFAIGPTTAAEIEKFTTLRVYSPELPSMTDMYATVERYFTNLNYLT